MKRILTFTIIMFSVSLFSCLQGEYQKCLKQCQEKARKEMDECYGIKDQSKLAFCSQRVNTALSDCVSFCK